MSLHRLLIAGVLMLGSLVLVATACGDDDSSGPVDPDNLILNPGFEDGNSSWSGRDTDAVVSGDESQTGSNSLLVELEVDEDSQANGAEFAYQEVGPGDVPEFLSFDYFIDQWVSGTEKQYIEAVVVVSGSGAGMPQCPGGEPCPNIQMRYVLTGVTSVPTQVLNARWRFIGEEDPVTGEWLHFEADLRDQMTEDWSTLPSSIDSIRLQLEVRFDERSQDELDTAVRVYWDNVYLGVR